MLSFNDDAVVIFDDTIQEKQWIDENEIMCWHFDHVVGQPIKTMAGCVTFVNKQDGGVLKCSTKASSKAKAKAKTKLKK